MKTLILILVLFSTSLFAENNLPAPFGIQLGEPVSDDLMCATTQIGHDFTVELNENTTFKEHYAEFEGYWHGNCYLVPPIKNKRYNRYQVFVHGDDYVARRINVSMEFPEGQGNFELNKEYSINLIDFLIDKYKVKRVYDDSLCNMISRFKIEVTLPDKFIKFCKKDHELSELLGKAIEVWDDNYVENNIKYYDLEKEYEINYLDRVYDIEECFYLKKIYRDVVLEFYSRDPSRVEDLKWYQDNCHINVSLENDDLIIDVTAYSHNPDIYYLSNSLKRSVIEYIDIQNFIDKRKEFEEQNKERLEKRKENTSVDGSSL